jgi:hypothetical protein
VVPSGSLATPGGAQGTQGIQGPTAVSTDAGNLATLGSDSLILVPQSSLWSARLRSFNAIGNPTFEVDQRQCGTASSALAGNFDAYIQDRWGLNKHAATAAMTARQTTNPVNLPGTNFRISNNCLGVTLTTQQTTLAASEYIQFSQAIEGPQLRELIGDVHSISVLAYCTQPITFSVRVSSPAAPYYTLTKLCQITTANVWTLIQLPNLPVWSPSATWPTTPGSQGYALGVSLGSGATGTSLANDTWQAGNFFAGPGTTNFASLPVNTVFYLGFIQHEPGPVCSNPPMDCSFTQNYDACLRYFDKSNYYGEKPGAANSQSYHGGDTLVAGSTIVWSNLKFSKPMARTPACNTWAYSGTASAMSVVNPAGGNSDYTVSSLAAHEKGINSLSLPSSQGANYQVVYQYSADTGW